MIEVEERGLYFPTPDAYIIDQVRTALRARKGPVMIRISPVQVPIVANQKVEA